ncbi:MAG: nucleotidyltransferase domain-containing protein [Candidatus Loosdrechtia sp.]|uniref:nucleotidyltransferase domain-containing protein n=1 Tax=Candidatus Loosdrechtia sp. TaxID=3101272 RepID=UPI003A635B77|nr:MAG: nucleotidyltransferase domain-containing protein [Candidatus Jettenia sp. AMX2]
MQKEYQNILKAFIQIVREMFKEEVISVVLFGSVARGTAKKESDIDLCIVIKNLPKSRFQRNKLLSPVIDALKKTSSYKELRRKGYLPEISPILYTPDEIQETKPVFLDMVDEGEILLDDGTFRDKLNDIKRRMSELNSRKVICKDGTWYWELKPGMKLGEVITL